MRDGLPVRFTAYDGSSAGPPDAAIGLHLRTERGLAYLMTAPGDLGMARAYVCGDLDLTGVHPGDPYDAARAAQGPHAVPACRRRREAVALLRGLGLRTCGRRPRRRRSTCRAGGARWRGCGTR